MTTRHCDAAAGDAVVHAVVSALTQPPHVAVNEVLTGPRDEPI